MPGSYVRLQGDKEGLGTDPALKEFVGAFIECLLHAQHNLGSEVFAFSSPNGLPRDCSQAKYKHRSHC